MRNERAERGCSIVTTGWSGSNGGGEWWLELERRDLIPGRLVRGRVRLTARDDLHGRAVVVTLRGEERWKHLVSTGKTTTIVEERDDLPSTPLRLSGPVQLARGESLELPFELPAPALGPPTVTADKAKVTWSVEAKLDREGFDSSLEVPVRVLQPTALLRAGVVHVGPFALFDEAEGDERSDVRGVVALDPVPLVAGSPFRGRLRLETDRPVEVRGIRVELKVRVEVTDPEGLADDLVAVRAAVAGHQTVIGAVDLAIDGFIDPDVPPTTELRHSRVSASFEVILDRALAPDLRLVREVAIAGTAEV